MSKYYFISVVEGDSDAVKRRMCKQLEMMSWPVHLPPSKGRRKHDNGDGTTVTTEYWLEELSQ